LDDELKHERNHLDAAYERLLELQDLARRFAAEAHHRDEDYVVDSLFERDVVAAQAGHRIAALNVPKGRMAVGRLDRDDGDVHYIGRLAIADAAGDPMIIDWRAPVAEAFYRAVPGDPMGVVRRRHFRWRGDELVGLDDEVLDAETATTHGLGLVGEGALLAALTAPRTGRMTDVVATIQAEQDRIIRRPKAGTLVVQGAPGTGKTAVALHRAAYLLYSDRHGLGETSILFVGPNPTFLRYVEEVVPSLGEDRVVLATPADLGPPVEVTRKESDPDVARLKGDARMADVLVAAVRDRERAPREELTVPCGRFVLHLDVIDLKRIVQRARRTEGTHNGRRPIVERLVVQLLQQRFDEIIEKQERLRMLASQSDFRPVTDLLAPGAVKGVADRLWPVLTAELLLGALYAGPKRRARVCRDLLSEEEQALLQRDVDVSQEWTDMDVALLDEATTLIGSVPARKKRTRIAENIDEAMVERVLADTVEIPDCPVCGAGLEFEGGSDPGSARFVCRRCEPVRYFRAGDLVGDANAQLIAGVHASLTTRHMVEAKVNARVGDLTYGHVVVDEAQDLSAMQWRALVRRCPSLSMTIVGDQGQAIRGGTGSWSSAMDAAGATRFDQAELTVNYRTPVEVMEAAEAVLDDAGVPFSRTRSVRSTSKPVLHVDGDVAAIVASIATEGTCAVIAPSAMQLGDVGCDVLDVVEAKGLEFDAVVVVDPDGIAAEGEGGARRVYVALTRTTTELHVVAPRGGHLVDVLRPHCRTGPERPR
jgi:DNA helicase IV